MGILVDKAIKSIDSRGDSTDVITILAELRKNQTDSKPHEILLQSDNRAMSAFTQHALRLFELSIRREMRLIGQYLVSNSTHEVNDIEDIISKSTKELNALMCLEGCSIATMKDALEGV